MKRKIVLSTTISTILLALAVFCFGVYASMLQQFSMTNTIGFTANASIFTAFHGEISGAEQTDLTSPPQGYQTLEEYKKDKQFVYDQRFEESERTNENRETNFNWTIGEKLEFKPSLERIIYAITIENYSEVKIKVSLSFLANGQNIENSVSCQILENQELPNKSEPQNITSYNSGQYVILDEYVIGQSNAPAKCQFYITTSIKPSVSQGFEEPKEVLLFFPELHPGW